MSSILSYVISAHVVSVTQPQLCRALVFHIIFRCHGT
jgi:hypothetical protein